ncbi:MAG: ATP-binding protein [Pseudomonadota bacterium]
MSLLQKNLMLRWFPDPARYSGDGLQLWRERVVAALLVSALVISLLALVPSLILAVREGLWALAFIDTMSVGIAGALLYLRRIGFVLRMVVILSITYLIGLVVIASLGPASGGPIWLFAFGVLAGVLLGLPAAVAGVAINAVTMGVLGWLYSAGIINTPGSVFMSVERAIAAWTNFIFLNAVVSVSVAVLLKGLQETTLREQVAVADLKGERAQLQQAQSELRQEIEQRKTAEEELAQQKGILDALHETTLGLIGRLDMNELLEAIVTQTSSLIESTNGFIYIYDETRDLLEIRVGTGVYGTELKGATLKPGEGLSGLAFAERRTVVIDDYRNWDRRVPLDNYDKLRSAMAVPILMGTRVFGVLGLGMFGSDRKFGAAEVAVMEPFAELVSLVIHNAQLYEDLRNELAMRRSTESALRERENQFRDLYEESKRAQNVYRSLLHSSADAIVISDMKERVSYVNPAFTLIFGWGLDEVTGGIIPFVPDTESANTRKVMAKLLSTGQPLRGFETRRLTKDGRMLDISISASRYDNHEGAPLGMLCILRDISENKQLQAQFHQAQRLEAIGTLAGGVAHDFNNLLMGLQGNVSLMQMILDPDLPQQKNLKTMESLISRGAELTGQLLGFARAGKYEVKPTDLNDIVGKTADMFGRTKKEIHIEKRFHQDLPTVSVDRRQVEQVLLNIFVNAWQAMPTGGDLVIETGTTQLTAIQTAGCNCGPGRYVYISIQDNGVGIPAAVQQRIFDPFFTTKEMGRGTGLGLASSYGILQNHGGFIKVSSTEGMGSTFTLYLPVADVSKRPEPVTEDTLTTGAGTILLVDDEPFVLDVGCQMLERLGYRVKSAGDSSQAIDLFRRYHAEIDAVILDMIMPGVGGGETFDLLLGISPGVKVLLSSGYSLDGQAEEILRRGCRGFIQKPFSIQTLSTKIREILQNG